MKTTVELSDGLLAEARRLARREGTTLKALLERGLRTVIAAGRTPAGFKLRDGSVKGKGLAPDMGAKGWDAVRDRAYEGRGA